MVLCQYYLAGTCRFGNSCKNEHTSTQGTKALAIVGEEVLLAERGRQWPLSCFSPTKDHACIPDMNDVSPEEVRWEMYQAQKSGTVEQTKLQFQQLCEEMRRKREFLKTPSNELAVLMDKIHKNNRESGFSSATTASPFGATKGNNFGSPATTASSTIFSRGLTNNTQSVFGGQPSFGGAPVFASQSPSTNSIFGGTVNSTNSIFGGNQNMPGFASSNQQTSSSIFGGNTVSSAGNTTGTSVFGQPSAFGNTAQTAQQNIFSNTQTTSSLFGGTSSAQPAGSAFGSSQPALSNSSSIFSQQKPVSSGSTFGGAPVFGNTSTFSSTQQNQGFGAQPTFSMTNSVFGSNTTTTSNTFGSSAGGTNSFAALATAPQQQNLFQNTGQNTSSPFGNPVSSTMTNPSLFGGSINSTSTFGNTNFTNQNVDVNSGFGTSVFTSVTSNKSYGNAPTYASTPSTPFASTTSTSSISNPFAQNAQQMSAVLGVTASGTTFGGMSAGPAGNQPIPNEAVDKNMFTDDSELTDDEKNMYMADQFILGKIPIKPPSIELR